MQPSLTEFLHHIKELIINIKPVVESKYTWLDFVLTINKEPYNDYLDYFLIKKNMK